MFIENITVQWWKMRVVVWYRKNGYKVLNIYLAVLTLRKQIKLKFIKSLKMATSKQEKYNNIYEKVSNDQSEQKYRGNIINFREGYSFDVGTLLSK